jgi:Tfp pilus assembly protein PilE
MRNNQKGFSVVEALLIAAIFSLIGFMSWYAWHNASSVKKTNSGNAKSIDKNNEVAMPFTQVVRKNEQHDDEGYKVSGDEITLYLGSKNTGGYDYSVEKVIKSSNKLTVFTVETQAGPNCSVTQSFTSPQITIKLQESITQKVIIDKSVKIENC